MEHAFTIDLEDWYHGIPVGVSTKAEAQRRLHVGTDRLLALLDEGQVKATFFVLSPIANEHRSLVERIASAGHDIGSHGLSHDLIYDMTPERFREETRSSIRALEDCIGKKVRSYRAAYFSITRQSLWALDLLTAEGIRFDSSIFPVNNWRYGIGDYSRRPVVIETSHGPLLEFPLSTRRLWGRNVPTTGGAYFRIYPYAITAANIRSSEREGMPVVFYLHPWELDPEHPIVPFRAKAMVTHYFRLRSTLPRLRRLVRDFRFSTLEKVLTHAFPELGSSLL